MLETAICVISLSIIVFILWIIKCVKDYKVEMRRYRSSKKSNRQTNRKTQRYKSWNI